MKNIELNERTIAAKIAYDATNDGDTYIDFDPDCLNLRDEKTFTKLALSAARFLNDRVCDGGCDEEDEDSSDSFDPLCIDVYRNAQNDQFIADVDLCVGGPTVWARYESRRGFITVYASWGGDRLEFTANDCPLIDWITEYVSYGG